MDSRDDQIIEAFAKVLQARRRAVGLSQEEFAHRAGLSTSYVSLLESRKRQPTLSVLSVLGRELDMTFVQFSQAIQDAVTRS